MESFKEESIKVGFAIVESVIMTFTPDDIIKAVDKLVHTAVDMDMSGVQKFNWVINEANDLLPRLLKPILMFLAQALYDGMIEKVKGKI